MADTPQTPDDPRQAHALELLAEAEKLTVPGDANSLGRASANAESAVNILAAVVAATPTPEARNLLAAAWMRRAIVLLVFGSEQSLQESIRCYDESIRLRRALLGTRHPALVHAHSSALMGRGDAFARLGGEFNLRQALASYDEGITLFRTLPVREAPALMARMIVMHGARAAVYEALRTPETVVAAMKEHAEIATWIRGTPAEKHPEFRLHLGASLANRANLALIAGTPVCDPAQARIFGAEAIAAVAGLERESPVAAEIAIKARRTISRAVTAQIEALGTGVAAPREFLNTMTDAADEALALARYWETKGVREFRPIAIELFGLGATLYVRHQTHFFPEYVLDNLDPEQSPDAFRECPEMLGLAASLVGDAIRHFERDRVVTTETKGVERQIETLRALRHASERLGALRPQTTGSEERR